LLGAALVLAGCESDDGASGNHPPRHDAGGDGGGVPDPGPGGILITASGESLAVEGYAFPPAPGDEVAFVDGWEVRFSRLLVTIDRITLSEDPDLVPTDPSQTGGPVAQLNGPWAVDLHASGAIPGKGGSGDRAVAITSVSNQNLKGGEAFDPTRRYAFGYDVVPATTSALRVNFDDDAERDYADMVANGYTVLYVGTATFRGQSCTSPSTTYDFTKLPPQVHFRFGFTSPTSYVNCQNTDNDPAEPFAGEEHQRGVQVKNNRSVTAQITIHTDHPFWEGVLHDSPAHFDPIAARFVGASPDAGAPIARLSDLVGVDFTAFKDAAGVPLPWRSCLSSYTPQPGTMRFDARTVPVTPGGSPDQGLRDYRDFMTYNQSTQGHLNADGLCFGVRRYPSPR
jgi:hypothetical protein